MYSMADLPVIETETMVEQDLDVGSDYTSAVLHLPYSSHIRGAELLFYLAKHSELMAAVAERQEETLSTCKPGPHSRVRT